MKATAGEGWGVGVRRLLSRAEAFEDSLDFSLGVPVHRRSLAADEACESIDCRVS